MTLRRGVSIDASINNRIKQENSLPQELLNLTTKVGRMRTHHLGMPSRIGAGTGNNFCAVARKKNMVPTAIPSLMVYDHTFASAGSYIIMHSDLHDGLHSIKEVYSLAI